MSLMEHIRRNANLYGESAAYHYEGPSGRQKELTWRQVDDYSDIIAEYLEKTLTTKKPIIVYGHKDPFMVICFLACAKSGRAHCPIDLFLQEQRVRSITELVEPELVFNMSEKAYPAEAKTVLGMDWLERQIKTPKKKTCFEGMREEEPFYIIFTSGSTGKPKGVQITRGYFDHFLAGKMNTERGIDSSRRHVFINEVPFSFTFCAEDLYLSLYSGGSVWAIDRALFSNVKALTEIMVRSGGTILPATPSFFKLCLADEAFSEKSFHSLERIMFCGEVLSNHLVQQVRERFPNVEIINTYGATEMIAATDIVITDEIERKYHPLPVGWMRPGMRVIVADEDGKEVPEGEKGEIIIAGRGLTAGAGYFKRKDLTEKKFQDWVIQGNRYRVYHTGDAGYMKDGCLFYGGRLDTQIKLNGFRIELEDIENNLMKIEGLEQVAVVPRYKADQVKSLTAYIVYKGTEKDPSHYIKKRAQEYLPEYMIPKKIKMVSSLPLVNNGKVDRKLLSENENA